MTFLEQLKPEQITELSKLRAIRTQTYVGLAEACLGYDRADELFHSAAERKRIAVSAAEQMDDHIASTMEKWAQELGIHEKIELDLNALP